MAPQKRKAKEAFGEQQQKFHCFSCATDRLPKQFPDYNPSADCEHLINTCKTCLKKWVQVNVESGTTTTSGEVFGIKCPQCDAVMRNVNVEVAGTKKVYQRFEEMERKHIGDTTPGWRWCLNSECKAGQVHESKKKVVVEEPSPKRRKRGKKAAPVEAEPDICTCHDCGAKACVTCDRPWHEGETCVEYQARTKDRMEEEDKALKAIERVTKPCPNCKKRIQKNGGCPTMSCSQCGFPFCWNCEGRIEQNGCGCRRW